MAERKDIIGRNWERTAQAAIASATGAGAGAGAGGCGSGAGPISGSGAGGGAGNAGSGDDGAETTLGTSSVLIGRPSWSTSASLRSGFLPTAMTASLSFLPSTTRSKPGGRLASALSGSCMLAITGQWGRGIGVLTSRNLASTTAPCRAAPVDREGAQKGWCQL